MRSLCEVRHTASHQSGRPAGGHHDERFFAIAEQTFSGLAQGREIAGNILLLGGPLYYYKGLRHAFEIRLKDKAKTLICPDNAPVFVAYGAALKAEGEKKSFLSRIIQTVEKCTLSGENIYEEPLFSSKKNMRNSCNVIIRQNFPKAILQRIREKLI